MDKGFIAFATGRRTATAGLTGGRQNRATEAILITGQRNRSRWPADQLTEVFHAGDP